MQLVRVHGPDDVRLDDVSAPEHGVPRRDRARRRVRRLR